MQFRDAVKHLRSELGITQVELAMGLNINAITVGRWENGRTVPSRSISAVLLDYARSKGATEECLDILSRSISDAAKSKLGFTEDSLSPAELSPLCQLIDDASFAIYVFDLETDEILYLNQKAISLIGANEPAVGKKCYACLMNRDTPCESCHKNELTDGDFRSYDIYRPFDGITYHIQGKLIQWNGRAAQVKYVLSQSSSPTKESKTAEWLKTIFENINGGVSVAVYEDSGTLRFTYANDRYYKLFGYTQKQFTEELKDPHDTVHPDDWDTAAAAIKKVKDTKQPSTFRYRIIKRDKSVAYLRCSSSVTAVDGVSGHMLISVLTDITESVLIEQQALVSGRRLDAIMQNMNSAVTASIIHSDGAIEFLFSNDLYHEMFGYTKEQFQSEVSNPFVLAHPDDVTAVRDAVFSLHNIGDAKEILYRAVTRDRKIKWIRARISIMAFPDAEAPVQLAVYSDTTDMVEAQEKLAAQHSQISDLLNDTPSGIAIVEVDRRDVAGTLHTTYYNDRFISFSGYDRAEYDSLLKRDEMAFVYKEDIPTLLRDSEKICEGEIGTSVDTLVRCHRKEGDFRWLLLTGQLVDRRGDICVINIAVIDITERQKAVDRQRISDEMLRIAAETDRRTLIVFDVKNNSCRVESRSLFSAEYGETFENIPQSLIDRGIVALDSVDELCALFSRIRNGEQRIRVSLQMHSGTDKFVWFECNAATVFDSEGIPDHAVLVFHDITEQRVKEAVFKKWQQSIDSRVPESYTLFRCNLSKDASLDEQQGNLLKISFPADTMSFNSRTKLYAEQFVHPDDRDEYVKLLDSDLLLAMFYHGEHTVSLDYRETDKSGDVMWRRMTAEMVEYPDSSDVQMFLLYEDIDECKKAELIAREVAESDPLTGALNRVAFAEKVDEAICENPAMNCALIMLDMDGFKHLNDTFGHAAGDQALQEVAAVLRSYARSGDLVCRLGGDEFLVWLRNIPYDAVIGKTAQQMCEHIRKAYSQEVMLSASAGIAVYPRDGHRYDDLYQNADKALYKVKRSGKGSYAFSSVIGETQTEEITEALSEVKPTKSTSYGAKRRMLIVEDDEASRMMLKNIFKNEYLIETAKNGSEAMIRLRHFGASISVVLLDLLMPGIDGFTVLRKMRNNEDLRTIPVVVVTGDEDHSTLLKTFELGAAEFVTKPVDVDVIRTRVLSVISKAENERLRAQNSYLMLQRDEEVKYRTVLESTETVVIEYDWRNHVFIYDAEISKYIAGNYDHRGLWQVFLSDMIADSADVKMLQDALIKLANSKEQNRDSLLIKLKTPNGIKHWFRMNIYKNVDDYGLAEKLIITFKDVHDEVLANDKLLFQATRDSLTGLYNRTGFLEKADMLIASKKPGYYVMACIDVEKFQVINDQYGTETGDEVLRYIADTVSDFAHSCNGICSRYLGDEFAVLYPAKMQGSKELSENHRKVITPDCIQQSLRLRVGRCLVNDTSLSASALFDRAAMAEDMVKGRYDTYIVNYDESMRDGILKEQQIVGNMVDALASGEFEPWFQPQYNHATGALIGAEALVRWRRDGKIINPNEFIPVFEKNGFIYEVDRSIWRQVCALLRRWLDEGKKPLPVSVNISRHDMFQADFVSVITGLVAEYKLPAELLRLEITESAFSADTKVITDIAGKLISAGFTVEIDDFGSGYSSLNTLKDVPASILKLDMRFFETTENSGRGGNIVEAVVRMAKWLGMAVIAEGVEDKNQADYLKSIGCYYIQGFYYSKPITVDEYEKQMNNCLTEHTLSRLETLDTLDSNLFWDPQSMETLIFNSYIGGACIFELYSDKTELLRVNEQYFNELGSLLRADTPIEKADISQFLLGDEIKKAKDNLRKAIKSKHEESCELCLTDGTNKEYIRMTGRVIARAEKRYLFYAVIQNITEQRRLERERTESAERLSIIMSNVNGGVSAIEINDDGTSHLIFHNDKYYELYGYARAEKGEQELDPMSFIIPEDFPDVMKKVKKLKADGQPVVIDYGIIKQDGSRAQIRANASLMSMEGYGPIITSVLTDVTKQRTLEDQLRAVVNNINGGVTATYLRDNELRFVLASDKYYEMLGYTREQYDTEVGSVYELIHPDDRERVKTLFAESVQEETPYTMEYRVIRRDGTVIHILCNANIMHIFGVREPIQLAVFNDVTLLREAQLKEQILTQQIQAIMQNIQGGISASVFHDDNHIEVVFANDGFYKLFGYTKEQFESEVPNVLDPILPDDRKITAESFARIVHNRGSETYEYRCRKRDGSIIWIQTTNTVISLTGVGDTVLLAVTTDVTALRRAEEQSREASDRVSAVMNAMTSGMTAVTFRQHIQFLFANDRYYQLHGIGHENNAQDTLQSAFSMIHTDDRERVRNIVMSVTDVGQNAEAEYRINLPGGMLRYIRIQISVTTLVGVEDPVQVAIYTDITEEKKASEQIRFLNESAGEILAQPDSEKAIHDTLLKVLGYFSGERSYIFELDSANQTSDNTYEICVRGVTPEIKLLQNVPYDTQKCWFDAFRKTGFVVIPDVAAIDESESAMRELLLSQNIHSIIVAPLWRDGKLIGYMGVDNPTEALEQVSQLIALSDYIAVLLTRRDLMKAVEHQRRTVQQLMDDTPGGFIRMELFADKNPVIATVNDGLCRMLGMTKAEVMGKYGDNVYTCLADEDASAASEEIKQAYVSGGQYTSTCRLRQKNGNLLWVMLFGRFVRDEADRLYLNAYFTDITEQKNSAQLQSDLLDNLPFGAAMYEYDGKKLVALHINKQYAFLVNREIDCTEADFAPVEAIHPDDRKLTLDEIQAAIAEGRNGECDIRLLYGANDYRLFHLDASIIPSDNGKYTLYVAYEPITDKEQELKTTSEQLKLLSDSIPGGIATFRCMPGNIEPIYYNDGICALTGYSRDEFNNSEISVLGLIFEEDKPIIRKQIELLISGETALDYSIRIHVKDGSYKWVECIASVTGRESENVFLISAVLTDITEHQKERERLHISEELNRLAIDQSGKIISRYDVAARTLTLPYTLPDIYNLPSVLENMPEEQVKLGRISRDTADTYCDVFRRINAGEATGEAVYQQNSAIGWRWLKSQFTTVFTSDGNPVSAVITFEDITDQRAKEAIYTRWQNSMSKRSEDSYTVVRCNLNKTALMDSWEGSLLHIHFSDLAQTFNSRTAEYVVGYVYADDRSAFQAFLNSDTMLAEYYRGHRSDSIEYREQNEDGSVRWLRLNVDLVEYPNSKDVEAYLLFENIDEQKQAELSAIHRAETDPLTGVLNRTAFAERVNHAIGNVNTKTKHAMYILDVDGFKQLNDIFGHGAGDQALIDIADSLTHFCRKDDLVGRLGGDEFFVFVKNITNEEDAARKAQQICDMTRKTIGVNVHISVSVGIAMYPQSGDSFEALYKIADEALYRTKNAGKDGYSFSFGNPVIGTAARWHGSSSAVEKAESKNEKSGRILIVDDDRIAQMMLNNILKDNFHIETAIDGDSALTKLHHFGTAISVVLLDLNMPGMNGFEVLEKIQQDERTCTIPVIVVSSDEDRETAMRVIRAGAYDLITKPVDADLLRIRVASAIRKSENERLRAQNSYLSTRNTEVNCYRTAMERTGTVIVTLDCVSQAFTYSSSITKILAGQYDEHPFWSVLLADMVTDEQTVQNMQQLVKDIADNRDRTDGSMVVRLKTASGAFGMFELNVLKETDDNKMLLILHEISFENTGS